MRARADWNRVMALEHQPASHERPDQEQKGGPGCMPVPGEKVLQPPPPACPPGTLLRASALLGQQYAAGLVVVTQTAIVGRKLLIRLTPVARRPVQPIQPILGWQVGE